MLHANQRPVEKNVFRATVDDGAHSAKCLTPAAVLIHCSVCVVVAFCGVSWVLSGVALLNTTWTYWKELKESKQTLQRELESKCPVYIVTSQQIQDRASVLMRAEICLFWLSKWSAADVVTTYCTWTCLCSNTVHSPSYSWRNIWCNFRTEH